MANRAWRSMCLHHFAVGECELRARRSFKLSSTHRTLGHFQVDHPSLVRVEQSINHQCNGTQFYSDCDSLDRTDVVLDPWKLQHSAVSTNDRVNPRQEDAMMSSSSSSVEAVSARSDSVTVILEQRGDSCLSLSYANTRVILDIFHSQVSCLNV